MFSLYLDLDYIKGLIMSHYGYETEDMDKINIKVEGKPGNEYIRIEEKTK